MVNYRVKVMKLMYGSKIYAFGDTLSADAKSAADLVKREILEKVEKADKPEDVHTSGHSHTFNQYNSEHTHHSELYSPENEDACDNIECEV